MFLIFNSCSTRLRCCKTSNDVKELLSGYWKEKNSVTKSLDAYSYDQHNGYYTEVEPTENKGEYFIIDDHPYVDVI